MTSITIIFYSEIEPPSCKKGHTMDVTTKNLGGYKYSFVSTNRCRNIEEAEPTDLNYRLLQLDICQKCNLPSSKGQEGSLKERWRCKECSFDYCFSCIPRLKGNYISVCYPGMGKLIYFKVTKVCAIMELLTVLTLIIL